MRSIFRQAGYTLGLDAPTNQVFVVLENETMERLARRLEFSFFEACGQGRTMIRLAADWATRREDVERRREVLEEIR